jgi:pimeloyl-ACP methyl ester carboxylesterase
MKRPQTPRPPFPYDEERVTVPNPAAPGVTLAATVTLPRGAGPHPAVVLLTGSGQQDRDESLFGHKPFAVLADFLTRRGFVVLRADDRGVGGSTGPVATATSADFATDAAALFAHLLGRKEVDPKRVGLIGHSEGGLIAPMVAAKDARVAFLVMLAGPGVPGDSLLVAQGSAIRRASGASPESDALQSALQRELFAAVRAEPDSARLARRIEAILRSWYPRIPASERGGVDEGQFVAGPTRTLTLPWMRFYITHDPRPTLAKVRCPVLALNGSKDLQVLDSQNLPEIQLWVRKSGNRDVTIRGMPGLNHLFQTATTGLMDEYGKIEETFAPAALEAIAAWLEEKAGMR